MVLEIGMNYILDNLYDNLGYTWITRISILLRSKLCPLVSFSGAAGRIEGHAATAVSLRGVGT